MEYIRKIFKIRALRHIIKWLDPESERLRSFIHKAAESVPVGGIVIDVGAGECQYKNLFFKQKYFAVDFASGDVNWDYSCLDVIGDVHFLPFCSGSADAVICTQVMEHVIDPQKVVSEIARVLKPGGTVFFTVPQGWGEHQVPHDYFRFTQFAMEIICSKAGLVITKTGKTTGLFGYLANRLTMIPKVLFWQIRQPLIRLMLFPLELVCYILFVAIPPFLLAPFDIFDKDKVYTLNYTIIAKAKK